MRSKSLKRSLSFYRRRLKDFNIIENYIKINGPTTFMDFVMVINFPLGRLHYYHRKGYIEAELINSNKSNGKEYLMIGVNWENVKFKPEVDKKKIRDLKKIESTIENKGPRTLYQLSRCVPRDKSTIRYWRNIGLLKWIIGNGRIIITGVNFDRLT